MCGLVGVAGNMIGKHTEIFRDMLVFDTVRGFDSTGVLKLPINGNPIVEKEVSAPNNLWDWGSSSIFDIRGKNKGPVPKLLMGHNRAATVGSVSVDTAHPFEYGDIIGAHNGTLWNYNEMEDLDGVKNDLIDSQRVFLNLSKKGIEDTWSKLNGAAALVWYDKKTERLNFIRNRQRPLWFAYSERKDVLYWSSEPNFIITAVYRNKEKLFLDKETENVYKWQAEPNNLYSFEVKASGFELKEQREISPFVQKRQNHGGYSRGTGGYANNHKWQIQGSTFNNKKWTKGSLKDKEFNTKGVRYVIKSIGTVVANSSVQKYAIGSIVSPKTHFGKQIRIYPAAQKTLELLKTYERTNQVFETDSKCRIFLNPMTGKFSHLGIDYCNTKLLFNSFYKEEKKEEEDKVVQLYPLNGMNVQKKDWEQAMSKIGYSCTGCCNPIDINDANKIKWYTSKVVLCEDCQDNDMIVQAIGGV